MIELRAQQITIDAPRKDAEPFVAVTVQRLILKDNKLIQRINRERVINRALSTVAMSIYETNDPISSTENQISGIGLANAITDAARSWILQEYPDFTNVDGRIIKVD